MLGKANRLPQPEVVPEPSLKAYSIAELKNALANLSVELKSLRDILELHTRIARLRYSLDHTDLEVARQLFLNQLTLLSELGDKKHEAVAKCSQRLLRELQRLKQQDEIDRLIIQAEEQLLKE